MAEDEEWSTDGDLNEDMAAAWEAELANEADSGDDSSSGGSAVGSERILNQDEIDSLLGFSMEEEAEGQGLRHSRHHQFRARVL